MKGKWAERRNRLENEYLGHNGLVFYDRISLGVDSLLRIIRASDVMSSSAALSYIVAFSLIPLITTTIAFLTAFPGLQNERVRLMHLLSNQLLPSAAQSIQTYIGQFTDRAGAAGAVSSLVFFIVVLMLFQSMESVFNVIWRVKHGRTWGERLRTLALFFISASIAATLFIILQKEAAFLIAYISRLDIFGVGRRVAEISVVVSNLVIAWILFSIAYRVLPNVKVRWGSAMSGGVVAGAIWHFLKSAFTWYINEIANYKNIYGALGAIPIFFLWTYLSFLVLLVGGYISFVVQNLETLILERRGTLNGSSRVFYAVAVTAELARAFKEGDSPLSAKQISESLKIPMYFTADALDALGAKGMVWPVSQEHDDQRYILGISSSSISLREIADCVAGDSLVIPALESSSLLICKVGHVFEEYRKRTRDSVDSITIADFLEDLPTVDFRAAG